MPGSEDYRRWHLHKTHVQRASVHTFRHSFASHFLQANVDFRTIQELLGHSDLKTIMIYTHTVSSVTIKVAKSPLDFDPSQIIGSNEPVTCPPLKIGDCLLMADRLR
ncbi:tyrosine-type recombinase/integrase [Methylomonas methanica]|uniref:tyrosine-type recombinase/integrase n=1 Tax=Methylomonas methanica TaxID=421 RepID=UPI003B0280E0